MVQAEIWIPIAISAVSLIVSILAFHKARPIERQQYDANAMLECFKILGNVDLKTSKKHIADERKLLLRQNKPIIFADQVRTDVEKVREAYNQATALYQLGLLNKEQFKYVYGGAVVAFWKMIREDAENDRKISGNPRLCRHLEDTAKDLMQQGINNEPY
jgi:hypothetical protein